GAGFIHMAGHSNPATWGTHPADDDGEEPITIEGMKLRDMKEYTNDNKLPVVVLGECHSAQFNVTMMNIIEGIKEYGIVGFFFGPPYRVFYMEWVPRDLSSWLVLEEGGGAIASMGNSGLGYGYTSEGATEGLGGWIEPRFFHAYANQSKDILGEAHDQAITDYINIIGRINSDQIDRKTIEQWTLIGDPSLQLGGV
ncbi:MAG: peptidase C25, partial [Thermoplasmatales archaeon]|nr:peptidase C25 [Thermoplasmatales archaeon]